MCCLASCSWLVIVAMALCDDRVIQCRSCPDAGPARLEPNRPGVGWLVGVSLKFGGPFHPILERKRFLVFVPWFLA